MSGPRTCRIDDSAPAMVNVGMGWVPASTYYSRRRSMNEQSDRGYSCGKAKHEAAVARRKKRKRGGPK